jgi:hypothetical protein
MMTSNGTRFAWLERLTAAVLLLVLLALAAIIVLAYKPAWRLLPTVEAEVLTVLALLLAALGLVSLVALLHTRRDRQG